MHAGKVSREKAIAKAHSEYEKFRVLEANKPSAIERDFDDAVNRVKRIASKPTQKPKPPDAPNGIQGEPDV